MVVGFGIRFVEVTVEVPVAKFRLVVESEEDCAEREVAVGVALCAVVEVMVEEAHHLPLKLLQQLQKDVSNLRVGSVHPRQELVMRLLVVEVVIVRCRRQHRYAPHRGIPGYRRNDVWT